MRKVIQAISSRGLFGDGLRFVAAGSINTLLTLAAYQFLLLFTSHKIAYITSWLLGILYLIVVYPTKVFTGSEQSITKATATALIYLAVFMLGYYALDGLVSYGINKRIAIFAVIAIQVPLSFVLMRILYRNKIS